MLFGSYMKSFVVGAAIVGAAVGAPAGDNCPAYRKSVSCDWTDQWACPPGQGTKGQASDDGSEGWHCCCSCGGSIDTAADVTHQSIDAAARAAKSCTTFNNQCKSDSTAAYDAFDKAVKFTSTSAFVCAHQGEQCADAVQSTVKAINTAVPHFQDFNNHCVHGKNAGDLFWCAGDVAHVGHDLWQIKSAIDTAKYNCGFGDTVNDQTAAVNVSGVVDKSFSTTSMLVV